MTNYVHIGDVILKLDLIGGFYLEGREIKYYLVNQNPSNCYTQEFGNEEDAIEAFISLKNQICIDTPK